MMDDHTAAPRPDSVRHPVAASGSGSVARAKGDERVAFCPVVD
jgi:hypothetical protein